MYRLTDEACGKEKEETLNNLFSVLDMFVCRHFFRTVYTNGHSDFGFICGRGVFNHPQGPRAGAMSLHQAWEAIVKGITLEEQGNRNKELGAAIKMFT